MAFGETPIFHGEKRNFGLDTREWLIPSSLEPEMAARGLKAVGWVEAGSGYNFTHDRPSIPMIYVGLEGWGEVWAGGGWRRCEPGMAYLTPAWKPKGYRSVAGVVWKTCWILTRPDSIALEESSLLATSYGPPLLGAIQGFYHEHNGAGELTAVEAWLDLIALYARRIGQAHTHASPRLRPLWDKVLADPGFPWTLAALTEKAALSEESLRRICHRETGRAPMEYVTYLRMRQAASLMGTHRYSAAEIGASVGYANQSAFSTAFKRVMGVSPSDYRKAP